MWEFAGFYFSETQKEKQAGLKAWHVIALLASAVTKSRYGSRILNFKLLIWIVKSKFEPHFLCLNFTAESVRFDL